jgi:hypothetical protein
LFEDSAPIKKTLSEKPNAKKRASDELDSLLASLGSDGDQQKDDQFDFSSDATSKAADKSRYAKFLQDESPEASPSPSSSLKIQKKQSLKNPTPSKKEQPKRKDSIYSSIDDSEQIDLQQTERENSTEILVQESHRLLASDTGKKRRSLKNPISHNKEKDSIDDVTTLTRKREDSLDRLFAPSSSKRKDSLDDLLYPSTSKARRTPSLDLSSESKMKRQDSFEFDGDFMGRNKDTPSRKKQSEPIDLLSDDDSDHKETTTKLRLDTYNDDKPRKFKPSSRLKVTNKPRKSSIDMLIDDDDMPVPSSPKEMPTRPHPKPSYEIMLNDSDSREESREESSQESSPTLEPKRLVQKRKRPSSELSNQNTSSRKSRDTKSIASVTLDDDDDDNDSLSITRSSVFDNDDDDDNDSLSITRNSVFDNDDNDEGGLDSDSFFNNLLLSKNKKDSFVNKRSPLESLASSSKSTNIYMDLDDDNDDDDEPIITDRKGKKRADAIRPLRKRQDSFDDVLGDDILTPKVP